jgi:hypothetical protein
VFPRRVLEPQTGRRIVACCYCRLRHHPIALIHNHTRNPLPNPDFPAAGSVIHAMAINEQQIANLTFRANRILTLIQPLSPEIGIKEAANPAERCARTPTAGVRAVHSAVGNCAGP